MNAPAPLKVFITGASSGLGLVARRADALAEFAPRFPKASISIYPADVRDADALALAASRFVAAHGCPDVVIANAGISKGAITGEGDLAAFREIMDVNYYGMIATFEPFIAPMTAARRGTLVGIASVAGVRGLPGSGAYSASKAAAIKYLEALRVELRPAQVAVVTIAPGYIRTPLTEHNPYPMPFLMDADRFAKRAALAISQKTAFRVIPWQMGIVAKLLHVMPRWLYDRLFEKAPRKPRAKAG
ncbi:SDR family oxidoreductase [Burkholderia pseudomallei]|uniref:SDR family oxidoreductase n=1 Tax=Burkholderia pseudomallei TaxID=28450 RepID=UPI0040588EFC